jgi:DNA-binding protein H-NS
VIVPGGRKNPYGRRRVVAFEPIATVRRQRNKLRNRLPEVRKRQDAFAAAEAAAREMGYSLAELTGASKTKFKSAPVPMYRHPENTDQTWSGRGRQPEWMKEALTAGKSKDDFLINA